MIPYLKIRPQEILKRVKGVYLEVPSNWFERLKGKDAFHSLYVWIKETCPDVDFRLLHTCTYVSANLQKRLRDAVKERLKQRTNLRGDDLENALGWADVGRGPLEIFGGCKLTGEGLIVIDDEDPNVHVLQGELLQKGSNQFNRKIRAEAYGRNFRDWLLSQKKRQDPVGDLAGDISQDPEFPVEDDVEKLRVYLNEKTSWDRILETFEEAWKEYQTYNRVEVVYFIQAADKEHVKIGRTYDVEKRIATLQTGHVGKLMILATMPGGEDVEENLHERFAEHRRSGEWFQLHPDIVAFIETIK